MLKVSFKGHDKMSAEVKRLAREFPKKTKKKLVTKCERIMARSKDEFVPVDLANLKNTGHVVPDPGDEIGATLSYGGPGVDYSIPQHERHDYKHTVGGPEYLKRPMDEAAGTFMAELAEDIHLEKQ